MFGVADSKAPSVSFQALQPTNEPESDKDESKLKILFRIRHMDLANTFLQQFSQPHQAHASSAGRVNLIGEHTDYNDGLVLPTPIAQRCLMLIATRPDHTVRVYSAQKNQRLEYKLGAEAAGRDWLDYIQAVTQVLLADGFKLSGFDAAVSSDVPLGSGLSSSAALLVTTIKALREVFGLGIPDLEVAKLAQRAENGLVGARVGLLDQMACSLGREGEALFIDFKTFETRTVKLPQNLELVIVHSGITHSLAAGEHGSRNYKTRRSECEQACERLNIASLRDLLPHDLEQVAKLPAPLAARAKHVITENARVLKAVSALESGDLSTLGALFYASHASMRDDYDVSEPEIDLIVGLARGTPHIHGARLTGGGFGGSVVMLADAGHGRVAGEAILAAYQAQTGKPGRLLSPT
jgi:galactokinase